MYKIVLIDYVFEHCIVTEHGQRGYYITCHRYMDADGDALPSPGPSWLATNLNSAKRNHKRMLAELRTRFGL